MRQDEPELTKAITELSLGRPSHETIAFLKSLNRPLDVAPIKKKLLVSQNVLANIHNALELQKINQPEMKFIAVDSGDDKALCRLKVEKVCCSNCVSCWNKKKCTGYSCLSICMTKIILFLQELIVKKGCPVMLLKNMSDKFVNGLQGTVDSFTDCNVTVIFPSLKSTLTVGAELFSV